MLLRTVAVLLLLPLVVDSRTPVARLCELPDGIVKNKHIRTYYLPCALTLLNCWKVHPGDKSESETVPVCVRTSVWYVCERIAAD